MCLLATSARRGTEIPLRAAHRESPFRRFVLIGMTVAPSRGKPRSRKSARCGLVRDLTGSSRRVTVASVKSPASRQSVVKRSLLERSEGARTLLLSAFVRVVLSRIALSLLPFRAIHRFLAPEHKTAERRARSSDSIERITWAITVSARRIPGASCLTQAIAAHSLLRRHGHAAHLRIGVVKSDSGALRAHAWIDVEGKTVLGQTSEEFTTLESIERKRSSDFEP